MASELAQQLMAEFTDSTGLSGAVSPRRYLWTDAFAVDNFLSLYRRTGSREYLTLALDLVEQVHHTLGRHRPDDPRQGWISGLSEEEGKYHPTAGGLRIGKTLNERKHEEPADVRHEWEQDGQYFHYLTKWMQALCHLSQVTGEKHYLEWAAELAVTAHQAFTFEAAPEGPKYMVWKMSIDLSRPLVTSAGHHDPLDGLVTFLQLQSAEKFPELNLDLSPAIADMAEMCGKDNWATDDALGIGGLLDSAARLAGLAFQQHENRHELLVQLLSETGRSLRALKRLSPLSRSADRRLAFRELGLSIGLLRLEQMRDKFLSEGVVSELFLALQEYRPLAEQIEHFWSQPPHRESASWTEHRDINTVMLATSLLAKDIEHYVAAQPWEPTQE